MEWLLPLPKLKGPVAVSIDFVPHDYEVACKGVLELLAIPGLESE